jgi:hypothetical protein
MLKRFCLEQLSHTRMIVRSRGVRLASVAPRTPRDGPIRAGRQGRFAAEGAAFMSQELDLPRSAGASFHVTSRHFNQVPHVGAWLIQILLANDLHPPADLDVRRIAWQRGIDRGEDETSDLPENALFARRGGRLHAAKTSRGNQLTVRPQEYLAGSIRVVVEQLQVAPPSIIAATFL